MEPKTKRMLKAVTAVMAVLMFAVAVLSFFTFSENDYVANYANIRDIVAANPRLSSASEKSGGKFSFTLKETPASEEDPSESGSGAAENAESESDTSASSSSPVASRSSSDSLRSSSDSGAAPPASSSSSDADLTLPDTSSSGGQTDELIPILGRSVLTKAQLMAYSAPNIKNMRLTCSAEELIGLYLSIGEKYGVRGDIAYLQAINETGWFRYNRPDSYLEYKGGTGVRVYEPRPEGLYVVPEDNNFCGLGVTGRLGDEASLCRFETAALGVEAQIQHLYAYACRDPLPAGTTRVDPRFSLVRRGCSPNWNDLGSGNWASNMNYGNNILKTYYTVLNNY